MRPSLNIGLCLIACATMFSYAVVNGAAQSLYMTAYGSQNMPWVWMAVAAVSSVVALKISGLAAHVNIVQLFSKTSQISAVLLFAIIVWHAFEPNSAAFLLYVWKDVYVIVLVELFWTFANLAFGLKAASRTYGFFLAAGSVGSVVGGWVLGVLAEHFDTQKAVWCVVPVVAVSGLFFVAMAHDTQLPKPQQSPPLRLKEVIGQSVNILKNSRYLFLMLALIALVQATLTLVEYRFNVALEQSIVSESMRTVWLGRVYVIINLGSFILQLLAGYLLRTLGIAAVLLSVPTVVIACLITDIFRPGLFSVGMAQILGKCVDYSVFRAAKEFLYIPLSYAEKTQGKALVDIMTYRLAKGAASMLILLMGHDASGKLVIKLALGLSIVWVAVSLALLKRHRRLVRAIDAL